MQRLKYLAIIVFALILTGCGQKVEKQINLKYQAVDAPAMGMNIVILPFADYTNSNDIGSAFRRNLLLNEALMDCLTVQGFGMPVSEDVFQYLVDEGIIKIADYKKTTNVSLRNELENDWSEIMKDSLRHYIRQQEMLQAAEVDGAPGTHALDTTEIIKLGREFQADYIVRGRILEFGTRQDHTWDPRRRGLLPVISGGTAQALFGFAGSESYDTVNQIVSTALLGVGIGSLIDDWPADDDNLFGSGDNLITDNEAAWGVIGGTAGYLGSKSGRLDQAVVRIRMWVQEASSGQVVWTNSAMVRVAPETVYSDGQYDDLFNTAIDKGVTSLVESFARVVL
ncbi:MAG: hypothetical protein QNJ17_10725 [Desulfocapsaceae bacterium]|nr:hypothetical protein [Desulfocapsaceae bacterium]